MNKRISILLAVLLALALFFVAAQAADGNTPQTVQTTISRDDLKSVTQGIGSSARNAAALPAGLKTAITNGILNCEASVDASSYQLAYNSSLKAQLSDFIFNSSPEFFNVTRIVYSMTGGDSPVLVSVSFVYTYGTADFSEMMDEIGAAAANLLNGIQGNASLGDTEKALLVHDRLALRCEYDRLYLETNGASKSETSGNMYGALVARQAVCQGYAEAYKYLLNKVGIDCEVTTTDMMVVNGQLAPHAWNIVYINGAPYHADVTWDDPTNDITGRVSHDNFLISTAKLTSDRNFTSTDYDFDTSPTRTTYDGYFWQNVKSAFTLLGQSIYYIDGSSSSLSRYADRQSIYSIDASWPVFDKPGYYYTDPMARLATDGVDLFFNTDTAVCRYSVADGTVTEVYTPAGSDKSIVGFAYEDGYFIGEFTSLVSYTLSTKTEDGFRYQYKVVPVTEALSAARVTLSWSSKAYNGSAQKPTVTVKNAAGNTLKKDTDYTLTYSNSSSKAPGSYTVTVTGKGGYTGTATADYTITKQPLNASHMTLSWSSKAYSGAVQKPTVTVKNAAGGTLTQDTSYTVIYSADSKFPGKYTVTAKGKGYYSGSAQKTYLIVPAKVVNLTAVSVSADKSALTWDAVPGAEKYMVYYATSQNGTYTAYGSTVSTSYTVSRTGAGTLYYKVRAFITVDGAKVYGAYSDVARSVPGQVASLKAVLVSANKSTLTWNAVPGAEKYMVYYATSQNGTYTAYGSTVSTSYTMSKTGAGTMYYKVRAFVAVDGAKLYGAFSAAVRSLPGQVKNLKAVKVNANKATLTWSAVAGAEKYMVYCSATKNGTYTAYGTTANTTYTVSKTGAGTLYYKVRAFVTVNGTKVYGAYSAVAQAK